MFSHEHVPSQIQMLAQCVGSNMYNVIILQDTLRGVFLLSTTTEWLLAFSIMVYLLTFIPGFKRLRNIKVKVTVDKGRGEKSDAIPNGDQVYFANPHNPSC